MVKEKISNTKRIEAQEGSLNICEICVHHWVIKTPAGATSQGKCKRCGAVRDFRNSEGGRGAKIQPGIAWRGRKMLPNRSEIYSDEIPPDF